MIYVVTYSYDQALKVINEIKETYSDDEIRYVTNVDLLLKTTEDDVVVLSNRWKNRIDAGMIGTLLERSPANVISHKSS